MTRGMLLVALLGVAAPAAGETIERTQTVGPVRVTLRLAPAQPVIGDPLTLEIEAHAEPGVELLMPEFGEALDRFSIVDFVPSERADAAGGTVARQRYTLQPQRSGAQSLPPILIEFVDRRPGHAASPQGEDTYELLTERVEFEVASVLPEDAPLELHPPRGPLPPLAPPGGGVWPWILAAGVLLAATGPFLLRAAMAWRAHARRRSASEVALASLTALLAESPPDREQMDAFFVRLSAIVRRYLEDRFGLRSPELTTEEFLEAMSAAPDLSEEHRTLLHGFLRRADLVKFARWVPDAAAVDASIAAARRFLEETREDAPDLAGAPGEAARA
jgi:hypothetical protein